MGSRSRYLRGLGQDLQPGDPGYYVLAGDQKAPVYGEDSYSPQPNYAPIGTGGTYQQNRGTGGLTECDPNLQSCAPVGTGGSPAPGQATGTGGYEPGIDYGPDMQSFSGYTGAAGSAGHVSLINVVTEGESSFAQLFQGTWFGLPRWLVALAGAGVAYKLLKRRA